MFLISSEVVFFSFLLFKRSIVKFVVSSRRSCWFLRECFCFNAISCFDVEKQTKNVEFLLDVKFWNVSPDSPVRLSSSGAVIEILERNRTRTARQAGRQWLSVAPVWESVNGLFGTKFQGLTHKYDVENESRRRPTKVFVYFFTFLFCFRRTEGHRFGGLSNRPPARFVVDLSPDFFPRLSLDERKSRTRRVSP